MVRSYLQSLPQQELTNQQDLLAAKEKKIQELKEQLAQKDQERENLKQQATKEKEAYQQQIQQFTLPGKKLTRKDLLPISETRKWTRIEEKLEAYQQDQKAYPENAMRYLFNLSLSTQGKTFQKFTGVASWKLRKKIKEHEIGEILQEFEQSLEIVPTDNMLIASNKNMLRNHVEKLRKSYLAKVQKDLYRGKGAS